MKNKLTQNEFSIGDTVSFHWGGIRMKGFILNKIEIFNYAITPPNKNPLPHEFGRTYYVVEVNFKGTNLRDDFGNKFEDGQITLGIHDLSVSRMVLIEKTMDIF